MMVSEIRHDTKGSQDSTLEVSEVGVESDLQPGSIAALEKQPSNVEISPEVWVPEFGVFDMVYLEPGKTYQGRLYRLGQEQVRIIAEALGFTFRFDSLAVRVAFIDIIKTEGHITFEVDRNAKPADINLRYMRDRWISIDSSSMKQDVLRPWMCSLFETRFLPEKVFSTLASQLRITGEDLPLFYLRINLKDRTYGLIAEDSCLDKFPGQPFQAFALPEGHVAVIPSAQLVAPEAAQVVARPTRESGPKYATYSMSEIDRMMKMQAENLASNLSGKISGQQRIFQEAIAAQEKAFNKIAEKFALQFEEARLKLETQTKSINASAAAELQNVHDQLAKELSEFRAHVNKNIVPISKNMEEKIKQIQVASQPKVRDQDLKPLLIKLTVVIVLTIIGSSIFNYCVVNELPDLAQIKMNIARIMEMINKLPRAPQ